MPSVPSIIVLLMTTFVAAASFGDETLRDTRTPSGDKEDMLGRFVAECIAVTPGTGNFPGKSVIGTAQPSAYELSEKEVIFSTPFRISKYEVTQELYAAIAGTNPSRWKGPRNSVETISWNDAVRFCTKLTAELRSRKLIGRAEHVRLPTSAEWEYCCRAGSSKRYSFGEKPGRDGGTELLDDHAWHTGNAAGNDPAVGVLKPNAWGLYDCHGYLWEFVADTASEPGKDGKPQRMIRGGSWRDEHSLLSCSSYLVISGDATGDHIGFRCVVAEDPSAKKTPEQ